MLVVRSIYHLPLSFSTEFPLPPATFCFLFLCLGPFLPKAAPGLCDGVRTLYPRFCDRMLANSNSGSAMDFQGRYQLLEMLSDGEARTFKALQTSSGRIVLLHQLWGERTPANQADLASLVFTFLRGATAEEMKSLLDMGEDANRVFVVTEDVPRCRDLRQWLQPVERSVTPPRHPEAQVGPRTSPSSEELARLLGESSRTEVLKTSEPPVASPPPAKEKDGPSEFTRMFLGSPAAPKVPAVARTTADSRGAELTPPIKPEPSKEKEGPSEFSRIFSPAPQAAKSTELTGPAKAASQTSPPVPGPSGPPPGSEGAPGEFTRSFFGKGMPLPEAAGSPPPPPEMPGVSPAGKPPERQLPAGFEVVFRSPKQQARSPVQPSVEKPLPPTPSAVSPEKEERGEFTRIFYGRDKSEPPPSPMPTAGRPSAPPVPSDQPSQSEGPGEFTRLFQARQEPTASSGEPARERTSQPPVSKVESEGPGEFTRLFQTGAHGDRPAGPQIPASMPRPTVPLSSSASQQEPGEFTRLIQGYPPPKSGPAPSMLEQPEQLKPPAATKADEAEPGEFTMLFQQPPRSTTAPPPTAPSPPAAQPPPASPQTSEPDEFARMFEPARGGANVPPPRAAQAPPPATPQAAAGRGAPMTPIAPVPPPMTLGVPYVQQPTVSTPMVPQPQPYQSSSPTASATSHAFCIRDGSAACDSAGPTDDGARARRASGRFPENRQEHVPCAAHHFGRTVYNCGGLDSLLCA